MAAFLGEPGRESSSGGVGRSGNGCVEVELTSGPGMSILMFGRTRGFVVECVEEVRAGMDGVGSGIEARPALIPTDVCTQRRNGEEWMTILNLQRFFVGPSSVAAAPASAASLSRKIWAILWPVARAWFQPL